MFSDSHTRVHGARRTTLSVGASPAIEDERDAAESVTTPVDARGTRIGPAHDTARRVGHQSRSSSVFF